MFENMTFTNLDAAGSIFFARELEQIKARSFEVLYAPLSAMDNIPVDATTDPGAATITYNVYDFRAPKLKVVSADADDIPYVDVVATQVTHPLVRLAKAFRTDIDEIQKAQFARIPLTDKLSKVAVESLRMDMNYMAYFGDKKTNVGGWLNNTQVPKQDVAGVDANAKKWINKTAKQKYDDLVSGVTDMIKATKGRMYPTDLLLPIKQHEILQAEQYGTGTDTTTLGFFLRNYPNIKVRYCAELEGGFPGGKDGFIFYIKSQNYFWQEIPQQTQMLPPQAENLGFKTIYHCKHGGTIVARPETQIFRTGI